MDIQNLLNSVPKPTEAYMQSRRGAARQYTLVFLHHTEAALRGEIAWDENMQLEHLRHLTKLQILGKLVMNGPTMVEHEISGVSVYAAEPGEARALAEADPKVKAGLLWVETIPWMAVPAD